MFTHSAVIGFSAAVGREYNTMMALAAAVSFLLIVHLGWRLLNGKPIVPTGWEAAWIAQGIVEGHGFSFPAVHRWLFVHTETGGYFPTAWVDPIYTYCLAGLMFLFGPAHAIAAVWLNAVFLLGAFAFLYLSAERWISPYAGVLVIVAKLSS